MHDRQDYSGTHQSSKPSAHIAPSERVLAKSADRHVIGRRISHPSLPTERTPAALPWIQTTSQRYSSDASCIKHSLKITKPCDDVAQNVFLKYVPVNKPSTYDNAQLGMSGCVMASSIDLHHSHCTCSVLLVFALGAPGFK